MKLKQDAAKFTFRDLEEISFEEILQVFNASFKDYLIPFHLEEKDFRMKMIAENIQLKFSIGAFYQEKLVGFILIGLDNKNESKLAYNAGTGVLDSFRGNDLTFMMYQKLFPILAKEKILIHQLEVLTQNKVAINAYTKIGFKIERKLTCYKGALTNLHSNDANQIREISFSNLLNTEQFRNQEPLYQNSLNTIQCLIESNRILGAFLKDKLVGYLIFAPSNFRIKQFGVHKDYRRKKIGTSLFMNLKTISNNQTLSITNLDEQDEVTLIFLNKIGLTEYVKQFEMKYMYAN